ncbi:polygalacturonase inhibitor-like [Iris pallida]|uniref:Polygalacturonase inhibitor-like n=1 Tax=Iris pallida TaxID=29817 RepID=A0AAX6GCN8_IRIPA|nr:polygalacturonase inhibitor-like [Iris pallida]
MTRVTILLLPPPPHTVLLLLLFLAMPRWRQEGPPRLQGLLLSSSLDATWLESTDCCSWHEVLCDKATGRVNFLQFNNNFPPPFCSTARSRQL